MNAETQKDPLDVFILVQLQQQQRLRENHRLRVWHLMHVKYLLRQELQTVTGLHRQQRDHYTHLAIQDLKEMLQALVLVSENEILYPI